MAQSTYVNLESRGYYPIAATSSTAVAVSSFIAAASAASATLSYPNFALIRPETGNIRWRDDGTAPTAAVSGGFPLNIGETLEYDGRIDKFQFIATAGSATLNCAIYNAF